MADASELHAGLPELKIEWSNRRASDCLLGVIPTSRVPMVMAAHDNCVAFDWQIPNRNLQQHRAEV